MPESITQFAALLALVVALVGWPIFLKRRVWRTAALINAAFEGAPDGMLIVNRRGRIVAFNQAFLRIWRVSHAEVASRSGDDVLSLITHRLEHPEAFQRSVRRISDNPGTFESDRLELKDAGTLELQSLPLYLGSIQGGRIWRFRDVSGQARAEKALAKERSLLRTLVDSLPDYIYAKDLESRFLMVNKPGARMMGAANPDQLLGKTDFDFYPEPMASQYRDDEKRILETGRPLIGQAETCLEPATNTPKWILTTKVPFCDESGKVLGLIGSGRDITELKRITEELRQAKAEAEAANRTKSEFLANMSHEVRTPMNGILGMTELALQTSLTGEQREYLNTVKVSAESLLTILNDILDFSKIEAGKLDIERIDFNLVDTVEEALSSFAIPAQQKGLELISYVDPEIPVRVLGDPTRLKEILTNLLGNSLKFTDRGEVSVEVRLDKEVDTEQGAHPERLLLTRFAVRDTGIGIPREKLKLIFEPFTQSDNSMTRKYGGTGLGLTISTRLVEMMGGRLWVESEPGQGAVFYFTLPLGFAGESGPAESETLVPAGVSVLVVDDNATNRRALEMTLRNWGMRPVIVSSGNQALMAIQASVSAGVDFGLMLVDSQMPDMDGFMLVARIKQNPALPDTPIIMLTSRREDIERCRGLGLAEYLMKPVRRAQLRQVITNVSSGKAPYYEAAAGLPAVEMPAEARRPLTILLAEDNAVNQRLGVLMLEKYGHSVSVAVNGEEVLAMLETRDFDVILLDIQMPRMDGFEVTKAIRTSEAVTNKHQLIIAITACAMKGDLEKCLNAGMDAYVSKPVRPRELFATLDAVLVHTTQ